VKGDFGLLPCGSPGTQVGVILFAQTFGSLANFSLQVQGLDAEGTFIPLPAVPEGLLAEGFRRAVLGFLVQQRALTEALRSRMFGGRYSGFPAYNQVRVGELVPENRKKPAEYRVRAPREKGGGPYLSLAHCLHVGSSGIVATST
jgi:hypothetical protein